MVIRLMCAGGLAALLSLASAVLAAPAADRGYEDDEPVSLEELQLEKVPVDERIFLQAWHDVPYDPRYFTYTDEQLREKWAYLMRGLRMPYPSAEWLRTMYERYPFLADTMDAPFDGDYEALERKYLALWRWFFAGDFQRARNEGLNYGVMGLIPAMFSQLMYAMYLTERQSEKYMMLQDVANRIEVYLALIDEWELDQDADAAPIVGAGYLGYAYAIARIAEDSPIAVAVARRYPGKLKRTAEQIMAVLPDHPMALGFRAGLDAGIMRRVGKFTGRLTYGARSTVVEEGFERALALEPDIPITAYEYGNALIYTNRKRDLGQALALLESASRMQPQFSMDALDTMYAFKRLQEIRLFEAHFNSFRRFEKARRKFIKITDRNLTNVTSQPLTLQMLENPDDYALPELR